ncbi:MAG: citrate/2-methylcitrate synthase [Oscillospiraceae bacterium]|nr:citrate/2-methylcitrate synthase [Oscillospiraceae bacterium]
MSDLSSLYEAYRNVNYIDKKYYERYDVKRGLRNQDGSGVLAGITNICTVHGYVMNESEKCPDEGKLVFRGYDINDLVENAVAEDRFGYEEIAYLLLAGKLPNRQELTDFCKVLDENRELPPGFFEDMILKAPSKNVMNKLSRSVLSLYSYDDIPDDTSVEHEVATAISIIAKMPVFMVDAYNVKQRYFENGSMYMHPIIPGLSTSQLILSLLRPDRHYTDEEAKLLDVMLMIHAEHGGGNCSTFTCRVLSSSGTDPYAAYSAAIGSLKGPRHGGANHKVMQMHNYIKENVRNWDDEGEVADILTKILNKEAGDGSGLIYGMGHAVYTLSDPRAVLLKRNAQKLAIGSEYEREFRLLETIERLTPELMHSVKGSGKAMCANVDMYSGFVYKMLGIPEDLFTPLFAVSRMAGWCAHRFEECMTGNRIIRPAYKSMVQGKTYVPIDKRAES